jgi:hypothetical protein
MLSKGLLCSLLSLTLYYLPLLSEEPWGKDAALAYHYVAPTPPPSTFLAGLETLILFHQQVISNADGPRSHYFPSSSSYMLTAIRRFGLVQGFMLGCDRLMRENNETWIYLPFKTRDGDFLKWDPVPSTSANF